MPCGFTNSITNSATKKTIVDHAGAMNAPTNDAITDNIAADITTPRMLPIPPSTTKDIRIAIHSQCFAGKNEKTKLTNEPAAPANAHPRTNEKMHTNLTSIPTNSALTLLRDVARIAIPNLLNFKNKPSPIISATLINPEYNCAVGKKISPINIASVAYGGDVILCVFLNKYDKVPSKTIAVPNVSNTVISE